MGLSDIKIESLQTDFES